MRSMCAPSLRFSTTRPLVKGPTHHALWYWWQGDGPEVFRHSIGSKNTIYTRSDVKLMSRALYQASFTSQRPQGIDPYSLQCRDQHCDPAKDKNRDNAEKVDHWTTGPDFEEQVIK